MVSLKNSFSWRYSNFLFKKFDSAQANTALSPSHLFCKYLSEREKVLTSLLGTQMSLIHEKNAKKSRHTATLSDGSAFQPIFPLQIIDSVIYF